MRKIETMPALEGATGFILFGVSAAFTVSLFIGFANVPWQVPLYVALGVAFASSKVLLWIAGVVQSRTTFKVLAIFFAVVDLGAVAVGLAGEGAKASATAARATNVEDARWAQVRALETSIAAKEAKALAYDQSYRDYARVVATLGAEVAADRKTLSSLLDSFSSSSSSSSSVDLPDSPRTATNFDSLAASLLGETPEAMLTGARLRLAYVVAIPMLLELGSFALLSAAFGRARQKPLRERLAFIGPHIVSRTDAAGTHTRCGRLFAATALVASVAPASVCPSCKGESK